jgi:hypothetical protein
MSRIGLISNPKSQRNRRGLSRIEATARRAGFAHLVLADMADLLPSLEELAADNVDLLVVNGGDGTLQAVLTALLEDRPFDRLPLLAVLPRGMTNMSAYDVGLTGKPDEALSRLADLSRSRSPSESRNIVSRTVLRVENIPDTPVQRAMFFGAGGICRAIEYCRTKVHPWRIGADVASRLTLLGLLASWMLRGGRSDLVSGQTLHVSLDNGPETTEELLLVLATTLDKLVMNSRPFWHQTGEPLRYTAIAYPPERLLRSARRVLYGGNERDLPARCYRSRGAHGVRLRFDGSFTLDGQMFDAAADAPLVITAPDRVDFVRI